MDQYPQVVSVMYDFLLYAVPQVAKFPRHQRYLLGERIENSSFLVLELLIAANFKKNRMQELESANIEIQKIRFLLRLCKDLKLISLQKYETMVKILVEVGKQIGGWSRSLAK